MSQFLNYNETYEILHDRIKAQHIEVEYWARNTASSNGGKLITPSDCQHLCAYNTELLLLIPFVSDLPYQDKSYSISSLPFDPTLCFYLKENVTSFTPPPHDRLVLIKDLPGRLWPRQPHSQPSLRPCPSQFLALDKAAQNGILRFYDSQTYEFTYYKKSNGSCADRLWYYTAEGERYLCSEDGFFLLQDIINIERIFFNRPRNECLKELGFDPEDQDFK